MKLIKQSYEILEQEIPIINSNCKEFEQQYLQNMYKHIEKCGRTCYKSEDKITEGSAEKFVSSLIKSGHTSVLEHGVIYLYIPYNDIDWDQMFTDWSEDEYSKFELDNESNIYLTTNYRRIIDRGLEEDLQYLCKPTEYHEKRHTVLLHSCIHVYKDLTRHRKMSFSIESTRYCNYSKGKFGGELKFVRPAWWNITNLDYIENLPNVDSMFLTHLNSVEEHYLYLVNNGWQPQQAAEVLPQCTAADVVMSGYDSDWSFVFDLRALDKTGAAHPLVKELMIPLREEFVKREWI